LQEHGAAAARALRCAARLRALPMRDSPPPSRCTSIATIHRHH